MGDKHFAVPWQALGQTGDRDLSLNIDAEKLKSAPGFEKGTLPSASDPLFHKQVYSFYNVKPYSTEQQEKALDDVQTTQIHAQEHTDGERTSDWVSMWDWNSWVNRGDDTNWARRLEEVIGTNIENKQGETIAELEDVIVDSREARVAYAVVSFGGTLGLFGETAIIPWNAIRLDLARDAYVTDVTLTQLERAKLGDTEYRKLEDRKHSEALYTVFGTRPYWEEFGYEVEADKLSKAARTTEEKADAARTTEAMADAARTTDARANAARTTTANINAAHTAEANANAARTTEANANAARTAEAKANEQASNTATGTVVSVSSYAGATPETQSDRGVRVRVRTESGSVRTVHLTTNEELQRQQLTLNRGDNVVITGEQRDYLGQMVLFAHEVQKDGKTVKFEK
jgi:sporulation protein YlmC with PRC-barrel domain